MDAIYSAELECKASMCDDSGQLGIPAMLDLFMDVATTHAIRLGCGWPQISKRGLFWLTVKTKAVLEGRPRMGEAFTVRTWPEAPDKMRCNRSYEISQGGRVLVRAKTEWAVLDMAAGSLVPVAAVFPEGIEYPAPVCPEPFVRVIDKFDEVEPFATYTVRSTDIDVGHHMNNVAYTRAVLGSFTCAELAALDIREVDCIFRNQCFEGDVLAVQRKLADAGGLDVRLATPEKTIFLMHLA